MEWLRRYGDHAGPVYTTGDATGLQTASIKGYYNIIMDYFTGKSGAHPGFKTPPKMRVGIANPSVDNRVLNVNRLLKDARGEHHIMINPKCRRLMVDLETLMTEAARANQKGKPYVGTHPNHPSKDDDMLSHASDSAGYCLWRIDPLQNKFQRFKEYAV
jgi:hypothetical protein